MNFRVVHTMPEEMEDIFSELQTNRGYYIMTVDEVYMLICAGQKPKDGYTIAVSKIHDEEGSLIVDVTESPPKSGYLHKPNPCYPYTLISLSLMPEEIDKIKHIIVRNTESLKTYGKIKID